MPIEPSVTTTPDPAELRRALESLRPTLGAIAPERVAVAPNVEPARAVGIVNGSLGRILALRADVARELGEERAVLLDGLPVAVHAAWQANVEAAGEVREDLRPRYHALLDAQRLLLADAESLALRGLVARARLDAGRPWKGYKTVATSVLYLVALFGEEWPGIAGLSPTSADELARLGLQARELADIVDRRARGRDPQPALELRNRALVHLLEVYDEVRRCIQFVRYRHGDAGEIAPSPHSGRHRRARARRAKASASETDAGPSARGDAPRID